MDQLEQMSLSENRVKITLTNREYGRMMNACLVLDVLSREKEFLNCIKTILGRDVETSSIISEFVNPIIRIPKKVQKKRETPEVKPKRESNFTKMIPASGKSRSLHEAIRSIEGIKIRFEDQSDSTCIMDIRGMLFAYLKTEKVDEKFLRDLAPKAMEEHGLGSRKFLMNAAFEISGVREKKSSTT
jgi:hypothetical protein